MITLSRKEFKKDPMFNMLYEELKKNHRVAPHTRRILGENAGIKGFTEESRTFVSMTRETTLYIHYDTRSCIRKIVGRSATIGVRIDSIGVYDSFVEYEAARVQQIGSVSPDNSQCLL